MLSQPFLFVVFDSVLKGETACFQDLNKIIFCSFTIFLIGEPFTGQNFVDADIEKGIMTVQVKEEYKHINGKTGAVTASKTVLLEEQQTTEDAEITDTVTINFYLPDNTLYKSYKVKKGTEIIEPIAPHENTEWFENGVKVSFPLRSEENKIINAIYK